MARRRSNRMRNLILVDLLDLTTDGRVMEIGPGPGLAIAAAASKTRLGAVVAVDHSALMLARTAARNDDLVRDGRLTLIDGDVDDVPASVNQLDAIWAMNVWHFWDDQPSTIAQLADRLKPGGTLLIGHQSRDGHAGSADNAEARQRLISQMSAAGLEADYRVADLQPAVNYVLGRRPADETICKTDG